MNSNGRWYTVTLLPETVRISLDFDDKEMAQEIGAADATRAAGVLTHIGYENITDVFSDSVRKEVTIGTAATKVVLPGWRSDRVPLLKIIKAGRRDEAVGERLYNEHEAAQPINAFPLELAARSGLRRVTHPEEQIQRFECESQSLPVLDDPTQKIPTVRCAWDTVRAVAFFAFLVQVMANADELDPRIKALVIAVGFLASMRGASTIVSFDDDSIFVRNLLRSHRIAADRTTSLSVGYDSDSKRNLVAISRRDRKDVLARATMSFTWPKATKVADSFTRFASRHQIPNSIHPDHVAPRLNMSNGRRTTRAGVNMGRLRTRS